MFADNRSENCLPKNESCNPTENNGRKIAFLLPNPCNPDYRVIKHAEAFAEVGYDVRIYCRISKGLPSYERLNGVTYIRKSITAQTLVRGVFFKIFRLLRFTNIFSSGSLAMARKRNLEYIERLEL